MIRPSSRVRVQPRRKARPKDVPEQEVLSAALTADQIDLNRQLHQQAAQSITMTLGRMQQRTQQASQTTPELEPFLTAYLEAAGSSLVQHTLEILNDQPRQSPMPPVPPPRRPYWRLWPRSIRRLIPIRIRSREEQPDGTA